MRLTWHHEADVVVLSMWRDHVCAGTFRLATDDVGDFVDALVDGLRGAPGFSSSRAPERRRGRHAGTDGTTPDLPPRQRQPGEEMVESFHEWAFDGPAAHRATAS